MKVLATRKLLAALGVLLCCGPALANEDELRYSGIEQRLASLESQVASQQGLQTASYLGENSDAATSVCGCQPNRCDDGSGAYFEYQMLWIRPHVNEDFAGKLSEEHHYSPRFVLGYEDACGIGGRVRYWRFDHEVDVLSDALSDNETIRFGMDVWDVEATNHLRFRRTDVLLSGGIRIADMDLTDENGDEAGVDALGLTMAADIRTRLCSYCYNSWSFVYGGRVSVLGGDWNESNDLVTADSRDDNLVVQELWTGLEYGYAYNAWDLYTRVTFELQNWHSDVLAQNSNTDSIGYIGPGVHFGANY